MKHFSLLAFLFICANAHAAPNEQIVQKMAKQTHLSPKEIRQHYNACDSGITFPMEICGSYRWMVEDDRLNQVYKQVLAQAKISGYDKSLINAQRAWIAYRDAHCSFEGEMAAGGGTEEGIYVLSCKQELTKQQAERLKALQ
jgi:uncharacterized protein YecT (DUF1311 family)